MRLGSLAAVVCQASTRLVRFLRPSAQKNVTTSSCLSYCEGSLAGVILDDALTNFRSSRSIRDRRQSSQGCHF